MDFHWMSNGLLICNQREGNCQSTDWRNSSHSRSCDTSRPMKDESSQSIYLILKGNLDAMVMLVALGADRMALDPSKNTLLHLAAVQLVVFLSILPTTVFPSIYCTLSVVDRRWSNHSLVSSLARSIRSIWTVSVNRLIGYGIQWVLYSRWDSSSRRSSSF